MKTSKYILFLLLFLIYFSALFAQTSHKIRGDFYFGLTQSLWQFPKVDYAKTHLSKPDTLIDVKNQNKLGLQIGAGIYYKLSQKWELRLLAALELGQGDTQLFYKSRTTWQHYERSNFSLPLQILWNITQNVHTPYVLLGLTPKLNIQTNKTFPELTLKNGDISFDVGIGYKKIEIVKTLPFSPELRFSLGLNNLLKNENSLNYVSIGAFKYHYVALLLHF